MVYKKTKKQVKRLKRRDWSARIGGYGLSAGFSYTSPKSKRSLNTAVVNIVRRDLETPHHYTVTEQSQTILQATHYTYNLLQGITQGDGNANRTGDIIHIDAIKFRSYIVGGTTYSNDINLRVTILKSREEYGSGAGWVSGLGSSQMYINSPSNPTLSGIIDPKKCTVVSDNVYRLVKQDSSALPIQTKEIEYTLKMDQKFLYETNSVYGKNNNLYMVVSGWQQAASTGVTNVGGIVLSYDLIFKNCK